MFVRDLRTMQLPCAGSVSGRHPGPAASRGTTPLCSTSSRAQRPLRQTVQCVATPQSRRPDASRDSVRAASALSGVLDLASAGHPVDTFPQRADGSGAAGGSSTTYATVPAVELTSDSNSFSIKTGEERLMIRSTGELELWRLNRHEAQGSNSQRLVATGRVRLPPRGLAPASSFRILDSHVTDDGHFKVEAVWGKGDATQPPARITVLCPPRTEYSWCQGLRHGFAIEYTVAEWADETAELSIDLEPSGCWFGGGHLMRQLWPLNSASWEMGPFYPFDNGPNGLNTLVSPTWMTSRGLLVLADPETPYLHVGMNAPLHQAPHAPSPSSEATSVSPAASAGDANVASSSSGARARKGGLPKASEPTRRTWGVGVQNMTREYLPLLAKSHEHGGDGKLRLQARRSYACPVMHHPLSDWEGHLQQGEHTSARVVLAAASDVRDACLLALRCLTPPRRTPSTDVLESPIWTTWARYKARVSQAKVMRFASEVVSRGLQRSVMEIDDKWQSSYGDLDFDRRKFPDPGGMVERLHEMGFKVTLWVMPFVEEASQAYREGAPRGYFVRSDRKRMWLKPGFFHWWNSPPVVALDVTNPEAVDWFVGRLRRLQDMYGIDGFKFDAGEPCFLPRGFQTHAPLSHPSEYTRLWVQQVAGQFQGGVCEVRTGHMTQQLALFTRMGDRFSTWDVSNGLRSIIPTVLTSGVLGYPFCLPDMIGGNCYFGQRPDEQLMVRWTQLNALLPAMQFSVAPWDVSQETERLCSAALDVREKLRDVLAKLAAEAADALKPMARPLWWLDPDDEATYSIFDQFALGDDIIVAPVVHQGAVQRDVYLTAGTWRDVFDPSYVVDGGRWLRGFDAPLSKLPLFQRVIDVAAENVTDPPPPPPFNAASAESAPQL